MRYTVVFGFHYWQIVDNWNITVSALSPEWPFDLPFNHHMLMT